MQSLTPPIEAVLENAIVKAMSKMDLDILVDQMKDVLTKLWGKQARAAVISAIQQLESMEGPVAWAEYEMIENRLSMQLGTSFAALSRDPLISIQGAAFALGAGEAMTGSGIDFMWNLPDMKSLAAMEGNTLFWIGEHYDRHIQAHIHDSLRTFYQGKYQRREVMWDLKLALQDRFSRSDSYWDLLADHTCTKVREVGRVSGYEQAGIRKVQFRAHLDEKTTRICRNMHGRIIDVSDMRRQVDGYLKACETRDTDKIKKAWPWVGEKQAEKMKHNPTQSMVRHKVSLPPLHARCRSITVSWFRQDAATIRYGGKCRGKKIVNAYTASEHGNYISGTRTNARGLEWREKDLVDDILKHHFAKHARKEFGLTSLKAYVKKSQDIVRRSDSFFVRNFKGDVQYLFASNKLKGYTVVDREGRIRGCYGHVKKKGGYEKCLGNNLKMRMAEIRF